MAKKKKEIQANLVQLSMEEQLTLKLSQRRKGLLFLIDFFKQVRPVDATLVTAEAYMQRAIHQLENHPQVLANLQVAVLSQLINTNLVPALTESGLLKGRGFVQEFVKRINHKFLPQLEDENDFLYVINHVFYKSSDYLWVESISKETWKVFFEMIGFPLDQQNRSFQSQLSKSLLILSYKTAHLGLEAEVLQYIPERFKEKNPFVEQNKLLLQFTQAELANQDVTILTEYFYNRITECWNCLTEIREIQSVRGASLSLSYTTLVMGFSLDRMRILADATDKNNFFDSERMIDFFKTLVRNEKRKNSIRELSSQSLGYIAYQIAEHKGNKGDKYITTTKEEYNKMIFSAMKGGFIICFVVIIKKLLGKLTLAPFWHSFAYSLNYSIGFVIIETTHSTLATKQPAFTASAVAGSLDTKKNEQPNLYNLAVTVARVIRSQLASFFGNLVVVFPVTYLFAWLYDLATSHKLSQGADAIQMLEEQHPWHSLSLIYACNTGFFLFASGLIAGFIQNKIQYGRVAERLQVHPVLRVTFSEGRLKKIGNYVQHNAGSIIGNIALGFFLGMSSVIVKVFGIPFDIRHITISAGNVAIGVYGIGLKNIRLSYLAVSFAGVLGIGFMNFLVSFSLAFIVAVKSRGIRLRDYPEFLKILGRYFRSFPLNFIRPHKQQGI